MNTLDIKSFIEKTNEEDLFGFNENQLRVMYAKYLRRNENGEVCETPRDMFERIAKHISGPEIHYKNQQEVDDLKNSFFDMMSNLEFLPGGRTIANAGTPVKNLANCFVIPVEDSMEGIFDAVKTAALIQKRGGGVGYCFSELRPKGSWVKGCSGVASGPISFMGVFDKMCSTIMQGNRRGAQMGTFHVWHPDVIDFIEAKDDLKELTNFNISVMLDDKFMEAVESNSDYDLIDPNTKEKVRTINAKDLFDKIAHHAWKTGEPGLLFIDTANKSNTLPHVGDFKATNPCAEIWLLNNEVCNLGSINLDKMVKYTSNIPEIDWMKIRETTRKAVHFLDNVIDAGEYPTEDISKMAKKTRRIGLGVLGFADMLYQLKIPYTSDQALDVAERIMKTIDEEGWKESEKLAELKGTFPAWEGSTLQKENRKVRNCAITAIAPTGTLSMVADTSGGCEPNFALAFIKNSHSTGQTFVYVNKHFEKVAKDRGFYSEELMEKITSQGTLDGIEGVPEDVKEVFEVAFNVPPSAHIKIQAAFQKYTSNSVSKTINFPTTATVDQVKEAYMLAWKTGCKGCTVYRDGSRDNQILNIKEVKTSSSKNSQEIADSPVSEQEFEMLESEEVAGACKIQIIDGKIVKSCE